MPQKKYKYIEISHKITKEIVKRNSVNGLNQRVINKIIDGISINLNHYEYIVFEKSYKSEMGLI